MVKIKYEEGKILGFRYFEKAVLFGKEVGRGHEHYPLFASSLEECKERCLSALQDSVDGTVSTFLHQLTAIDLICHKTRAIPF